MPNQTGLSFMVFAVPFGLPATMALLNRSEIYRLSISSERNSVAGELIPAY
jgi:hypothetical protein